MFRKVVSVTVAFTLAAGTVCPMFLDGRTGSDAVLTATAVDADTPTSGFCGARGNEENVCWEYNSGADTLTLSGSGRMYDFYADYWGNVDLPWDELTIRKVVIKDGVVNIGDHAFDCCSDLKSITIASSVTEIGYGAFEMCHRLTSLDLPDGIVSIGDSAFNYCDSLTSLDLPNGLKSIGRFAFYCCSSLKSVMIPDTVTSIGGEAFSSTPWLDEKFAESPLWIYNDSLIDVDRANCVGDIVIPDGVTSIGIDAFYECQELISITLPDSITNIGDSAFYGCTNLESVTIPDSVTSIGHSAFLGCSHLTSVIIPESVVDIGGQAFKFTPWLREKLNEDPVWIYKGTLLVVAQSFEGSLDIPDSVNAIGDSALAQCADLTSVTIPGSVTDSRH